jgi:glycosyltransferase involved in cell wall biosynthesis
MRIALIGTRGVPARYGGFETCVEEVGSRLANRGHKVVVYCRTQNDQWSSEYRGMKLVHLPAPRVKSVETLAHTTLAATHVAWKTADVAILFNVGNAPLASLLRLSGCPVAIHVDGIEWQRSKWNSLGRRYFRMAERFAVRHADKLIADSKGIQEYYLRTHHVRTTYLSYGAPLIQDDAADLLDVEYALEPGRYHLVVARIEPENNVHLIVNGYCASSAKLPLVVVGSTPYAKSYLAKIHSRADSRVMFLGGVWNQDALNQLYRHCLLYFHGHSVGGTNPSLLRAAGAGAPVAAFNVDFNREVMRDTGMYFSTSGDVRMLAEYAEMDPTGCRARGIRGQEHVTAAYDWDHVANDYESLCSELAAQGRPLKSRPLSLLSEK